MKAKTTETKADADAEASLLKCLISLEPLGASSDAEASRWWRVAFVPLIAEIHKTIAEIKEARKGLTPAQREEIKHLDEANLRREDFIAELETAIPRLEATAAEARATHDALLAEHNSIAAQIDRVRQLINS